MTASFDIRNSPFGVCPADIGKRHANTIRCGQHPDLSSGRRSAAETPADYILANPPFNDSDTALRGSAFLQREAKPQVVSEAKDNLRKDDDVRWQKSEQHICNL